MGARLRIKIKNHYQAAKLYQNPLEEIKGDFELRPSCATESVNNQGATRPFGTAGKDSMDRPPIVLLLALHSNEFWFLAG
jgi:hypothetical protein